MNPNRLEPVLVLLVVMIIFFTLLLMTTAKFLASDGQTFQVISGLLTGFSGAFIMRVKPSSQKSDDSTLKTTQVTLVEPKEEEAHEL